MRSRSRVTATLESEAETTQWPRFERRRQTRGRRATGSTENPAVGRIYDQRKPDEAQVRIHLKTTMRSSASA
jgi:hypothetical protein